MQLNPEKTEVMNSSLSHKHHYKQDVVVDDLSFSPNSFTKFLGVFIDNKLSFNKHVDSLVSACSSRLFLMRKLKTIGLNSDGLKAFYLSNIRSKLSYAAPAWYSLLGEHNRERLERIQRAALKIISPNLEYDQ